MGIHLHKLDLWLEILLQGLGKGQLMKFWEAKPKNEATAWVSGRNEMIDFIRKEVYRQNHNTSIYAKVKGKRVDVQDITLADVIPSDLDFENWVEARLALRNIPLSIKKIGWKKRQGIALSFSTLSLARNWRCYTLWNTSIG